MRSMRKRGLSFLLSAAMVMGLVPAPALAEVLEAAGPTDKVTAEEVTPDEDIVLTPASTDEIHQMVLDESYEVSLEGGNECYWVGSFTAPQAGTYRFYSTGDEDTYAELYADAELNDYLSDNDDGPQDRNFQIDYTLSEGETVYLRTNEPSHNAATYNVTVAALDAQDLAYATISLNEDRFNLSEGAYTLEASVVNVAQETLTAGTDYELVYYVCDEYGDYAELDAAPVDPGEYYVAARGIGSYTGETPKASFCLHVPSNLAYGSISLDQCYFDLSEGTPTINATVEDSEYNTLTEGTDYELVYYTYGYDSDNDGWLYTELDAAPVDPGEYYVAACGIGSYTGETSKCSFNIYDSKSLASASFWLDQDRYDLTEGDYSILASVQNYDGEILVEGTDYELVYFDHSGNELAEKPSTPGSYYVAAYPATGSSYTGETTQYSFVLIGGQQGMQTITLDEPQSVFVTYGYPWTGSFTADEDGTYALKMVGDNDAYIYWYADEEFDEYVDSFYMYNGATEKIDLYAGQTIYLKVDDNFGDAQFDLSISKLDYHDLSFGSIYLTGETDKFIFTGEAITPEVRVRDANSNVVPASNYDLAYYDYDNEVELDGAPAQPGSFGVKAIGKGDYRGETYYTDFNIVEANDLSAASIRIDKTDFEMTGSPIDLGSHVRVRAADGTILKEGTHYELVVTEVEEDDPVSPVERGSYEVYARALEDGGYTGQTYREVFWIYDPKDISAGRWKLRFVPSNTVTITDGSVSMPTSLISGDPDGDGITNRLIEGTDYRLAKITASGKTYDELPAKEGIYRATYEGIGAYTGTLTAKVYVEDGMSLSHCNISLSAYDHIYTGEPQAPEVRITDSAGNCLVEGTDFRIAGYIDSDTGENLDGVPCDPGFYEVVCEGMGDYSGQVSDSFTIVDPFDLRNGYTLADEEAHPYTGDPVELNVTVYNARRKTLVEGTDYELIYYQVLPGDYDDPSLEELDAAPVEPGDYGVAARAVGDIYTGETSPYWFGIGPAAGSLPSYEIVDMTLDNEESLSIEPHTSWVGRFTAPHDGVYTFSTSKSYGSPYGDLYADENLSEFLDSSEEDGNFTLTRTLKADETVYLRVRGYGNYGVRCTVKVSEQDTHDLSIASVTIDPEVYVATGSAITPNVTVTDALGNVLTEGTDYELNYTMEDSFYDRVAVDQPVDAGTYYVSAQAKGSVYTGTTSNHHFEVADPAKLSYGKIKVTGTSIACTGSGVEPNVTVQDMTGKTLTAGTDYELVYTALMGKTYVAIDSAPSEPGKYRVAAKGMGSYTGMTSWVTINLYDARDLSTRGSISFEDAVCYDDYQGNWVYQLTGSSVEPTVVVRVKGQSEPLVAGTDYTVSFTNNTGVTTYSNPAIVTIEGKGDYRGTLTEQFAITNAMDLDLWLRANGATVTQGDFTDFVTRSDDEITYLSTGEAIKPTVTFLESESGIAAPVEGTDFTVSYVDVRDNVVEPAELGSYDIVLTATGDTFSGTATIPFRIASTKSLSSSHVTYAGELGNSSYSVSGASGDGFYADVEPTLLDQAIWTVTDGLTGLREGVDYVLEMIGDAASGMLGYLFTGMGSYTGSVRHNVYSTEALRISIADATITVDGVTYDGTAQTPAVSVSLPDQGTLDPETDYDVAYADNTDAGTATVTVTGKGDYKGTATATFTIARASLVDANVEVTPSSLPFTGQAQTPAVTVTLDGRTLSAETDYDVAYSNNVSIGTAMVTVTGKGNYIGSAGTEFAITASSLEDASVTVDANNLSYTGEAQTPAVTVTLDGKTLSADTDYTVAYTDNTDAGTATVTVTGKGGYTGTATATFTIARASLADASVVVDTNGLSYTDETQTPAVTVTLDGKTLNANTDYDVAYAGSTAAGNASVTVTGKGNYTGTATTNFAVDAVSIAQATVEVASSSLPYTGQAQTPAVTVTLDGKTLKAGTDYTVSYTGNVNAGTATVTVTGKGGYVGTATANFTITAVSLEQASVTVDASGLSYTGQAQTPAATVTLDSKALKAGTDYTVAYANNTNAGTATVTVTGKGGYKGTATAEFAIAPASLAQASVSVAARNLIYTGKAQSPAATVKVGGKTLASSTDYNVSYTGNVNAGTAKATVTGKGNYTGSKAVTFTIGKANNPMTAKAKAPKAKAAKVSKRKVSFAAKKVVAVSNAQGTVTYKKTSGNAKITVAKSGKLTIKKGLKAGTYKVKIKVTAAGNANYNRKAKTVTVKVTVN